MIGQTTSTSPPQTAMPQAKAENVLATDQLVKVYGGRAVVN